MQCIVALGVDEAPRSVAEIDQNDDGTDCVKLPDRKGFVIDDNRPPGWRRTRDCPAQVTDPAPPTPSNPATHPGSAALSDAGGRRI
jgi:hypothetical protein